VKRPDSHDGGGTRRALWVAAAVLLGGSGGAPACVARASAADNAQQAADAPPAHVRSVTGARRAPSAPVLGAGSGGTAGAGSAEAEGTEATVQGEADPLVGNGLGSPLCKDALGEGLSGAGRRDCETSGFIAAPAPTGDYGIDVHIDVGVLGGFSTGGMLSAVQDLFVTPLWMALVWAVHALVVMLEWSYTIDLLDSASARVGRGLRQMQSSLTGPWLASVLAVASVLAAYNGLVRRRVAETLGHALMTLAMMAGGMWVILDPTGTVGALGGWANQASLGTLAVTARGTPVGPGRALADSMESVFAAAIEAPWCYLEFGNVGWCRDPAQLDPRLRAAGLKLAAGERVQAAFSAGEQAHALERSAEQLRDARSNAEVFLALPPNGPARNSINEADSLLRALCQSSDATACRGPTAAQAQFRTGSGTWARVAGLLLIVAGVLGMLLLLGFVALRLLGAALFSLLYLLLAPVVVLAPALGESGRAAFRTWLTRLLGAVVAKLMYSFLLGVVLAVVAVLGDLGTLGWWTQWLLMSSFWWGAYTRRHQALGLAEGRIGHERSLGPRSFAGKVREALDTPRAAIGVARRTKAKLARPAPNIERRHKRARAGAVRAGELADAQVAQSLEREQQDARGTARLAPETQARLTGMRSQLARIQRARGEAAAAGDTRGEARLGARERRIAGGLAREEDTLARARRTVADADSAKRRTGQPHTREQREERARLLDAQAALPAAGRASVSGERRDYPALAGLAGHGRDEYEQLDPRRRREARAQIDRELATRRELGGAAADLQTRAQAGSPGWLDRRAGGRELEGALGERLHSEGHSLPGTPRGGSRLEAWKREGYAAAGASQPGRRRTGSPVLDDAREVAARRKRQLGRDRP
jgi:hypothetical protein